MRDGGQTIGDQLGRARCDFVSARQCFFKVILGLMKKVRKGGTPHRWGGVAPLSNCRIGGGRHLDDGGGRSRGDVGRGIGKTIHK